LTTDASPESSSSKRPRILFVDVSARRGGAETSLDELVAELASRGSFDIAIATARSEATAVCQVFRIPPVHLHRPTRIFAFMRSVVALMHARRALSRVIRDFRPDIVHANGIAAVFALPSTSARVLWHVRDWPRRPYAAIAASRCEAAIAISRPVENALRHVLPASLHNRVRLVENGIDLRGFTEVGDHADGFAIGMVANLVPWKRHDLFIEAAVLLRDFRDTEGRPINWVIAGCDLFGEHDDYVATLKKRIADAGLTNRFVWLEGRSATEIFPLLDLLVHPTAEEPFGRVICEAMAAGVPVVACDSAGPGSILSDGKTGFLFPKQVERRTSNVECRSAMAVALAERIRYALTHPAECAAIAAAAKAVVRDRYAIGRVADKISAFYFVNNE
jgi:glycosyltransferase involved in cell wall biosynthesis